MEFSPSHMILSSTSIAHGSGAVQNPAVELYFDYNGPRTNNRIEGWHSRLKKVAGKVHPNIFEIVDVLKKEQACTEMKTEQFESGATQPAQKKRYVDRERRIRTRPLFDRFQNGEYNLADCIASVRHQTSLIPRPSVHAEGGSGEYGTKFFQHRGISAVEI